MKSLKKFLSSAHFITLLFFLFLVSFPIGGMDNLPTDQTLNDAKASIASKVVKTVYSGLSETNKDNKAAETFDITGELRPGDTLSGSFKRHGVPEKARVRIIGALQQKIDFKKLRPGDRYSIDVDEKNDLLKCIYEVSPIESYTVINTGESCRVERDKKILEARKIKISGAIDTTLFDAFPGNIRSPKLVYAFADIFSSRIDFNTEIRIGDRFNLIVEEYYLLGEFIGYGPILAANYERSNGELFEAFKYYPDNDSASGSYFDQNGKELGSSFIRSPVGIGRVSSRFTWRRKHPILGIVRPHLGVDLAAPAGTPVMAAADGKITFIGRNGGYGKQVIIDHGNEYFTYYGHLSGYKRGLRVGQKVKQKQIIGYVGSTGLSTGPHLDYRVKHNGSFKNPFSLKYRPRSTIKGERLAELREKISPLVTELYTDHPDSIIEVSDIVVEGNQQIAFL